MKKAILLFIAFTVWVFGFNYNGTWINKSVAKYNDPIKLDIKGNSVAPYLKRGNRVVKLKTKKVTNVGTGLFEAWGFGYKNLVLYIKPINSQKIRVYEKKIDTQKKQVITRSFLFVKKRAYSNRLKRAFIGNWKSTDQFSAISKLNIRVVDNQIYVRAWKHRFDRETPLGLARAKFYNNRLHITWYRGNLVVNATISGLNYNSANNRYQTLKLNLRAKNINSGLENRQIIYLRKNLLKPTPRPIQKHIKVGPVDINLLLNSY